MNPYYSGIFYPLFCGEAYFQTQLPCHSTELIKFRQRLDKTEDPKSCLHIQALCMVRVLRKHRAAKHHRSREIDKLPPDSKLAISIIDRLNNKPAGRTVRH